MTDEWKDRVIREHGELLQKLEKLKAFIAEPQDIEAYDFALLISQGYAMQSYADILGSRIKRMAEKEEE